MNSMTGEERDKLRNDIFRLAQKLLCIVDYEYLHGKSYLFALYRIHEDICRECELTERQLKEYDRQKKHAEP